MCLTHKKFTACGSTAKVLGADGSAGTQPTLIHVESLPGYAYTISAILLEESTSLLTSKAAVASFGQGHPPLYSLTFGNFLRGIAMKFSFLFFIVLALVLCIGQPGQASDSGKTTPPGEITSEDGRVGIGTATPAATLDVYKGEIKIGSSGAACTKELAGMIRFADDQLQVCNSHGWQSVTVGVPAK